MIDDDSEDKQQIKQIEVVMSSKKTSRRAKTTSKPSSRRAKTAKKVAKKTSKKVSKKVSKKASNKKSKKSKKSSKSVQATNFDQVLQALGTVPNEELMALCNAVLDEQERRDEDTYGTSPTPSSSDVLPATLVDEFLALAMDGAEVPVPLTANVVLRWVSNEDQGEPVFAVELVSDTLDISDEVELSPEVLSAQNHLIQRVQRLLKDVDNVAVSRGVTREDILNQLNVEYNFPEDTDYMDYVDDGCDGCDYSSDDVPYSY